MAFVYLDTSALVKRYVAETGSLWVQSMTNPGSGNTCSLATVTAVEVIAALYRRHRSSLLTIAQAKALEATFLSEFQANFRRFAPDHSILTLAVQLVSQHPLRAYDAIQLATALRLQNQRVTLGLPGLIFLSADMNLNQVAVSQGLNVDDPNQHP